MRKNIAEQFHKKKCCGCEACIQVCPKQALTLKIDSEGFKYPSLNKSLCVSCQRCVKVCPFNELKLNTGRTFQSNAFAVKHLNESVREQSRSGGIFTALSDFVLKNNGVVYGCELSDSFKAIHKRATNAIERNKMRGSKYVQSDMGSIYTQIIDDLKNDTMVMFTGTPCQVQAVKNAVPERWRKNLLLVDIVCHGVPSPLIWQDYLAFLERKYNGKVTGVDFRNKKFGWKAHTESIWIDGKEYDENYYTNLFYSHLILRPSCFSCPFKCLTRSGDVTIADCWGIDEAASDFNDNKGVSLALLNNEKGKMFLSEIYGDCEIVPVDLNKCMQPPFKGNFVMPSHRKQFWKDYDRLGIEKICDKYGKVRLKPSKWDRIRTKLNKWRKKSQ